MNFIPMKRVLFGIASIPLAIIILNNTSTGRAKTGVAAVHKDTQRLIRVAGIVEAGDTMENIFDKHGLSKGELSDIFNSSRNSYNLSRISVGNVYSFEIDRDRRIRRMQYGIDESSFLNVMQTAEGFTAETVTVDYETRVGTLLINIKDNLILSMPNDHKEYLRLALELSDIFAWDIDFSTDIRNGDSAKLLIETLWVDGVFRGYGNILAAEFLNGGKLRSAYRFDQDGRADYYNEDGKSLRKTLLRSPLRFRHISSHYSQRRFHPILKIYRPHLGVDYAAPQGTPVSAAGDGVILFAGYKGQNGNMVRIRHTGGLETYYGHLARMPGKVRKGARVSQGEIIGYVGSTGLSTGPHLDYRIRLNGRFVNPLKINLPRGRSIPQTLRAEFTRTVDQMNTYLVSVTRPVVASSEEEQNPAS